MARWHPKRCRVCGMWSTLEEPISAQGFCSQHGYERMLANNLQISEGNGPFYERWVRRSLMAAHRRAVALDDDTSAA